MNSIFFFLFTRTRICFSRSSLFDYSSSSDIRYALSSFYLRTISICSALFLVTSIFFINLCCSFSNILILFAIKDPSRCSSFFFCSKAWIFLRFVFDFAEERLLKSKLLLLTEESIVKSFLFCSRAYDEWTDWVSVRAFSPTYLTSMTGVFVISFTSSTNSYFTF